MGKDNRKNRVPIVGEWKPVSFMIRKESGEEVYPFGEDARGSIICTESGRYFVQLTRADRILKKSEKQPGFAMSRREGFRVVK
ncbi:MAG: hypothetical protein GTN70_06495 [Deltaproteobacteria bacterium]|nr:hypothetical protein [Deltaproteobacteria bacterium]NIS77334.1 hypothetical protein [Deltaproteobacteria bacterium]